MSRYIFRYAGSLPRRGADAGLDAAEVVRRAGAKLVDDAPNMLLVECSARVMRELALQLPDWQLCPENVTPLPRVPRPVVRTSASPVARARRR